MRPRKVEPAAWKTFFVLLFSVSKNLPDGVEGGEPLLDGVGRPCRLTLGVPDAHLGQLCAGVGSVWMMGLIDLMRYAME